MKQIIVSNQSSLPFLRILRITLDGIRYRLFRAAITVAVIAVAVAFLLNILGESLIKRAIASDTQERITQARLIYQWTARLSAPTDPASILRESADPETGLKAGAAFSRMGGLEEEAASRLQRLAPTAVTYLDFFDQLEYAQRRRLVHQADGTAVFDQLSAPEASERFNENLLKLRTVSFPTTPELFRAFLAQWPELKEGVQRVREGQKEAIAQVAASLQGRTLTEALADAEGAFGQAIEASGFALSEEDAREVARQAELILDARLVEDSLEHRTARQVIARHHDVLPSEVSQRMLWRFVENENRAKSYLSTMQALVPAAAELTPERLVELSRHWQEMGHLEEVFLLTADLGEGWMGLGQRMSWLLFVSMLVCAIGISNAMFMTVTERFREIATLKCLGALDSFILTMFVLESCLMGAVGGVVGGIAGLLLGSGRMFAAFGPSFIRSVPAPDLLIALIIAIAAGVLLAAVAALYPSFKAARLAPMEAMRVE